MVWVKIGYINPKCDDDTKQSSRNLQRAAIGCEAVVGLCVSYLSRAFEAK